MKTGNTLQWIFSRTVALSLPLAAVLASQSAKAADYSWIGGASADWTQGWSGSSGNYPLQKTATVTFSSAVTISSDFYDECGAGNLVTFEAEGENGLTATDFQIGTATYGELLIKGGAYTAVKSGDGNTGLFAVPCDKWPGSNRKGKLTLQSGTITANNLRIGGAQSNSGSTGDFVMEDGVLTIADAINLCNTDNGTATFTMNGGTATTKYFVAGNKANANATATIAGGSVTVTDELRVASGNPSTGTVTVSGDGTRIAPKNVTIGNGTNGNGTINVNGGTFAASGYLRIAEADTTTGKFIQTAGNTSVASYLCVGSQANTSAYNALFQLDGGTVTNTGTAMIIGAKGGANSVAKAVVNDGELVANQIWVAENSSGTNELSVNGGKVLTIGDLYVANKSGSVGTMTISDNGLVSVGSAEGNKTWLRTVGTATINLNGGTLSICHLQRDNGTCTINFNGGTVHCYGKGNNIALIASSVSAANVLAGGAKFDMDVDNTVDAPLLNAATTTQVDEETGAETTVPTVDGGIVKKGSATLELKGANNTYNGPTVIEEGTLYFNNNTPFASTATPGALVLAGGTFQEKTSGSISWPSIEIRGGQYTLDSLPTTTGTRTLTGGTLVVSASDTTVDLTSTPVTANGGTLSIDVSSLTLDETSKLTLTGVTVADASAVSFTATGAAFDWTASVGQDGTVTLTAATASGDNEWIGGASGNWKDAVNWKYGVPTAEQTVVFDTDATVTLDGNKTVERLVVDSTVKLQKSANTVYPQIYLKSAGGTGTIKLNRIGLYSNTDTSTICEIGHGENDDLTIEIEANGTADSWFEGAASGKGPIAIYAKVTGSGYLNLRRTVHLWGDMSEFSGVVTQVKDNNVTTKIYFGSAAASSANATWNLTGDVYLGFSHSDAKFTGSDADFTGTLKFGTLNTSNTATMKVNAGVQNVVLEVGAGTWGNSYFLVGQSFSTGSNDDIVTKDVTLKKVGSGTLAYNGFGIPKIEVAEGVFSLGTPNTSLNHYLHTYTTIDSLTVAEGAVLTGSGTRTVTNTTLESGAILRQAIAASGETYTCDKLTIYGPVAAAGAVLTLVDSNDYLASAEATAENLPTFTLLDATSVTGKPTGTVEMATSGWGWQAKVRESNTKLVMIPGPTVPGFIFIVR